MTESPQSITCRFCGLTSYNPQDVLNKYCGNCHTFQDGINFLIKEQAKGIMQSCPHVNFDIVAVVNRLVQDEPKQGRIDKAIGYTCDIQLCCADCRMPCVWLGLPVGIATDRPVVSYDHLELRAPFKPVMDGKHED